MRDMSFGQYYPTASPIHKLDARVKILLSVLYIVFIFFVPSYVGYFVTLLFITAVFIIGKIPMRAMLKSVKGILFLLIFMAALNVLFYKEGKVLVDWWIIRITDKGIDFAIKMALRLLFLVMGASVLTLTTSPMELTDGIESLLSPLKLIKIPVHDFALAMSITLRFIPTLMEETDKIIMAQKARGSSFDTGGPIAKIKALIPVLIPLFTSAFRKSYELADALDARCYNATKNRTRMKVMKPTWRDVIAFLVMASFITFICLDKWYFHGLDALLVEFVRSII